MVHFTEKVWDFGVPIKDNYYIIKVSKIENGKLPIQDMRMYNTQSQRFMMTV
jgi:hypothetical protein